MKLEINGKVVEVDDSFANLPPEQQQAIVNEIAAQLAPKEKEGTVNALYGIGAGAIAGPIIGRPIAAFTEGMQKPKTAAAAPAPSAPAPSAEVPAKGGAVENWARTQHAGEFYGGKDYAGAHQRAINVKEGLAETPGYKAAQGSGLMAPREAMEDFEARKAAKEALAKRSQMTFGEKFTEKYPSTSRVGAGAANVLRKGAPPFVGRAGAGAMAGYQGVDAYNRAKQGDILGAGISGLGSAGAVASMAPNPKVRAVGALTSVLGEAINRMRNPDIDPTEVRMPNVISPTTAGVNNPMATGGVVNEYAGGGLAYLSRGKAVKEAFEYGGKNLKKLSDWAQDYIDNYFVPTQSDRMRFVGGPSFSANQLALPEYKNIVWGSGQPGTATAIANLAKDPRFGGVEKQIFAPLLGEAKMHQSNKMIFDRMMEDFFKNPEKLTPELRKTINDYIRSGGMVVGSAKKTKSFEPIPEFDVADKQMLEGLGKTFNNRKIIAQHAFGGEGIGGRKAQIIPYEKILQETTDPTVLGAPTFSMGPRAFRLTGETLDVPRHDLNAAFPYKLFGQDLDVTYPPVPSELSLMDFQRQWRKDTGKTAPLKSGALPQPGYYEHTMGYTPAGSSERIYPRQKMTENWVKELQRSGFNEGGLAE
jgi:hypothetical protein